MCLLDKVGDVVVDVGLLVVRVVILVLVVVELWLSFASRYLQLFASIHDVIVVGVEFTIDVGLVVQVERVRLVSFTHKRRRREGGQQMSYTSAIKYYCGYIYAYFLP
jgi:hypothetical protein